MKRQLDPVIAEYAQGAKTYDRKWSFYVESTTRETLARLAIRPADRVLDVGCGTGELLARLAARYPAARLAGLDPVPQMLEVAQSKLSDQVDLRVGWANELPWPGEAHFKTYREAECAELLRQAVHVQPKIEHYKISWLWGLMTAVAQKAG